MLCLFFCSTWNNLWKTIREYAVDPVGSVDLADSVGLVGAADVGSSGLEALCFPEGRAGYL